MESGKGQPHQTRNLSFDLSAFLENIAVYLSERAFGNGLEIIAFTGATVPARIRTDSQTLRQIVTVLARFALEHAAGTEVALFGDLEKRDGPSLSLRFYISGIRSNLLSAEQKISFEELLQALAASGDTKNLTDLRAADELAKSIGTPIEFAASPARGNVFFFSANAAVTLVNTASLPAAGLKGARILVADDNVVVRQSLKLILESMGCKVNAVEKGAEVLPALVRGFLANSSYRLVLLDLQMPGLSGTEVLSAIREHEQAKDTRVILLTLPGQIDDCPESLSSTCFGILQKPIRKTQLREMVELALGLRLDAPHIQKQKKDPQASPAPKERKLKILLAEDDVLSQQIASLLFSRLGLTADMVFNGAEAVEAIKSHDYDLVFMDIHMPIMSGPQAAQEIRKLRGDRKNIPIYAMTASDIENAARYSTEAGMNGYITKPLDIHRISQMITSFIEGVEQTKSTPPKTIGSSTSPLDHPVLDISSVLASFDNDISRYRGFLKDFIQTLPGRIDKIETAFSASDWEALEREAHTLKGIAATMGAIQLSKISAQLDNQAKQRQSDLIPASLHDIHDIIKSFLEKSRELVPEGITQELRLMNRAICAHS